MIDGTGRRRMTNTPLFASNIGTVGDTSSSNDVDDFDGTNETLTAAVGTPGNLDFVFRDINLTTTVSYESDGIAGTHEFDPTSNPGGTTSIKMIEVTAAATGLSPITLRAFTCNIGQTVPLKPRPYQ